MKFLIIQTAFLGDVILATAVAEKLHQKFPAAEIDMLVRKGSESVLAGHPFIKEVLVLDKKQNKLGNLFSMASRVRSKKYDHVINLHRFGSSGFIAWRSGAKEITGFDKNPLAFCFTRKIKHEIGNGKHEVQRNQQLIEYLTDAQPALPRLHPSTSDVELAKQHAQGSPYICIAPASVWFTKQLPKEKWIELIKTTSTGTRIFLLGASGDSALCEQITRACHGSDIKNLAGKLTILQTAALMQGAKMNYVNDSAPLHIASAMNASVTAFFCSTVPAFGFGPLNPNGHIIETKEKLECRPCGLHGYNQCPKGHFKCANSIVISS